MPHTDLSLLFALVVKTPVRMPMPHIDVPGFDTPLWLQVPATVAPGRQQVMAK